MNTTQGLPAILTNSASIYYILIDTDGRYHYVNSFFRKIFGYLSDEVLSLRFEETIHLDDISLFRDAVEDCHRSPGSSTCLDLRKPRADGSLFWTRWEFSLRFDENGDIAGLQGIGNDITERKRAESERKRAQENLSLILDNTDESFIMVDHSLNIVSYNRAAERLMIESLGVPLKRGLPVLMFADPDHSDLLEKLYSDALRGIPGETEVLIQKVGRTDVQHLSIKPVFTDTNEPYAIIITGRDITEKKRAEERLIQNERHFRSLIENSADALLIVTSDGQITDVSPSLEKLLGCGLQEILERNPASFVNAEDIGIIRRSYYKVLEKEDAVESAEFRAQPLNAPEKWVHATLHNLSHQPDIRGVVINFSDITFRKQAEVALQESEEKYRFLFYVNPQPMWIYDLQTLGFLEVNTAAIDHYGYTREDFYNMTIKDIRPQEDVDELMVQLQKRNNLPGLSLSEKIWRHKKKNGEIIYVQIKSHNVENNGRPGILVSVNDITLTIKAEQELKKSNERFNYAVRATSEAIWEWDIESNSYYIADAFATMMGRPLQKGAGFGYLDMYMHPDDIDATKASFKAALLDPSVELWQADYRFMRANGQFAHLSDRGWIIRNGLGTAVRVVGSMRDMTESKQFEQELLKSKERFELAGKATSDAIWDADITKGTILWGEGYETLFGYELTQEESDASSWTDNIHPEDRHRVLSTHNEVLYGKSGERFWKDEYRFIRADGSIAYVIDKGIIIRDEQGNPYRMIGAMQDITEMKEAEEVLSRERYLLRTLIDHLPDYIYVKDTEFRHVINNQSHVELVGAQTEQETLGKTVFEYFPAEIAKKYIEVDRQILATGEGVINLEELMIARDGRQMWLLTTKVPLKDERNRILGLVGISRDITERKTILESLRKTTEQYKILSKATNDTIYDWDLVRNTLQWNEAIKTIFGYTDASVGEFIQWWEDSVHPSDRKRVVESLNKNIREGIENWQSEYRFACADGTYKHVFDRGFILMDEKNRPYRMIGAMMDITERKQLEEELASQKINRQRQITEATIRAQEKERAEIGRELHDNINQILTTTKLYIDMALNEEDIREELLQKSYKNVSSAIEEIRILSKSLVPPSLGDIGIKEAIAEMIGNLNIAQKLNIRLKTSGFTSVSISGDVKLMVFRIVQEQVNNILKHSKATDAEVKLAVSRKILNITVSDNGVGFDPKKKTRGIGLNNITSRAELYHGQVELVTGPGKGCILKVTIPI